MHKQPYFDILLDTIPDHLITIYTRFVSSASVYIVNNLSAKKPRKAKAKKQKYDKKRPKRNWKGLFLSTICMLKQLKQKRIQEKRLSLPTSLRPLLTVESPFFQVLDVLWR